MGKSRKKHNAKARQQHAVEISHIEATQIKVDIAGVHDDKYDEDNPLALPAEKRRTKIVESQQRAVVPLSKKQRKKLQNIVDRRAKKSKRAELLESLQNVQATQEEIALLTSTTDVYSGKTKRKQTEPDKCDEDVVVNAISGSNKKARIERCEQLSSSSDDTSDEETDSEMEEASEAEAADEVESVSGTSAQLPSSENYPTPDASVTLEPCPATAAQTDDGNKLEGKSSAQKLRPALVKKPVVHIPVSRPAHIQECRLQLPILGEEQVIMEVINDNPIVVMCGETGCGKTTQVPQFLYEAGYAHGSGIIGVTEPRRVAAISMSKRVAEEMSLSTREVSYQIRYEGNVSPDTKIKFMTDGILLKEIQKDFLLNNYSVIILDEAHERSVYTDLLLGLLSRIVPLRHTKGKPLKLIIMSATLRVQDFTENKQLFKTPPPVIQVDARQFPVAVHFNRRTPVNDYLGEAYKKVCKIHRKLPAGGILVFVTGQKEVHTLCAKLRQTFPSQKDGNHEGQSVPCTSVNQEKRRRRRTESESSTASEKGSTSANALLKLPKLSLNDYSVLPQDEEAEVASCWDDQQLEQDVDEDVSDDDMVRGGEEEAETGDEMPLYVLPLYSLLPSDKQAKVFEGAPEGVRLCVVATNVAETSLTIPGIKYVVDTGKVKNKFFDKVTGVSTFKVTWTSKASADQRAGRSGRLGPGHCYRLYSSAVFNDEFEKFSQPEITRRPVDDLVLQMKDMGITKVVNFPFPTRPQLDALQAAEKLLISLGALEKPAVPLSFKASKQELCAEITALGHVMACFPVSPRYAKMLALGHQHHLLPYVVALVAALSVQELLILSETPSSGEQQKEDVKQRHIRLGQIRRTWSGIGQSRLLGDLMVLLKAVGACEYAGCTTEFCSENGIRHKAVLEIRKLRAQLTNAVNSVIAGSNLVLDPKMEPPSDTQSKLLRQIILAGLGDQIARKLPDLPAGEENAKKMKNAYQCSSSDDPVFIHPASVLYKQNFEYVVYQFVEETSKLYMKGVAVVEPEWLPVYVPNYCQFSAPKSEPQPRYSDTTGQIVCHCTSTFGPHSWPIPAVEVTYPTGVDRFKWFARFLLEGEVVPKLKKFTSLLLSSPSIMIKSWSKLHPRTEVLLKELMAEGVDSRDHLLTLWRKNPEYLKKAYMQWIPQSCHLSLQDMWPPL